MTLLCAAPVAWWACERAPVRGPTARRTPGAEAVTVTAVTGPVREVSAEQVVEDEAGPPAGEARGRSEPARPERTLEELEKAVGKAGEGGDADLDPLQAVTLAATLGPAPSSSSRSGDPSARPKSQKEGGKPRLVVYDFECSVESPSELSTSLGAKVADILTGHAARAGLFETFAELEQEQILAAHPFAARRDTPAAKVAFHAREHFGADVVIWGRVTGKRLRPTVEFLALDLGRGVTDPGPRLGSGPGETALALRESHDCPSLHYIPVVADRILETLAGRPLRPEGVRVVRRVGPNIVKNGSFSRRGRGRNVPGWESPLPEGAAVEEGRLVLRLTRQVATTHGLGVYSDWIRVEPGVHYELSCRSRADGVTIIVWARGYAEFPARTPGERGVDPRREAFRHQFRPASQVEPDENGWMAVRSKPFRPRHFRHEIRWMRVRLYAFGGGAGTAEFDDIVLREVEVEGAELEDERMLKAFGEKAGEKAGEE